jgi:glycerophosphoryl diester phosphodiesterase
MLKIGHRGASGTRPENSCAGFKEALRCKVDMIELDVRTTKDDKLVVFHDEDLKRVCGVNEKVSEITLKEFKKYDIGSYFSFEYSDERVMTLQEVINMLGIKTGLNIEAKICGNNREVLAVKIANLIIGEGIEKRCVITSFDVKFIKIFKEMYPNIKAGIIFENENDKWIEIIKDCEADGISINYKILDEEYIKECKKNGYFIYIWSLNDSYEIKKYKKMKIDGIISDFPAIL